MKTDRRQFLKLFPGLPVFAGNAFAAPRNIDQAKERSDPGRKLIRDALAYAEQHKAGNTPPALREEILDNPGAVFIIKTNVAGKYDDQNKLPPMVEEFRRAGYDAARLIFRKGNGKGGTTWIQPNFVGGFNADARSINNSTSTHPGFVCGFADGLRELGNTNIVVGANGAASHENFRQSGVCELLEQHGVFFVEAKYKSWHEYIESEVTWLDYPEGKIMLKVPFISLIKRKDTTLINMAKTRVNTCCFTTLTIKNHQGMMPVGYMHNCNTWGDGNYGGGQWGAGGTWTVKNAMNIQPKKKIFNPSYQKHVELQYIRHAIKGYKHWDVTGEAQEYFSAGGYEAYKRGEYKPGPLLFWEEQWDQRIMDVISNSAPSINMVEGIAGEQDGALRLNNFITISRNMVACDAVTSWLMGHDPRELPYLRTTNERGFGENDIEKIPIFELTPRGVEKVDYRSLVRARMGVPVYDLKPLRFF
ncbi:MAG: DUF362 domain-containing protein [Candidatus Latescibacterota bacterium]